MHFRALGSRDISHYEMFTSFHDAFYRFVEPASVTPMSLPCRQRALHAALVSVVRQWPDGPYSDVAKIDSSDPSFVQAVASLRSRIKARCADGETDVGEHLDQLVGEWSEKVAGAANLVYRKSVAGEDPLLITFQEPIPAGNVKPWRTLQSMRSVDADVNIKIEGRG